MEKTQDQTGSYHIRYLETLPESKKIAIAHFLRFVHPFNYFLCPKKDCELNNKCKELAEYPPLLHYVHDYMLETFGDAYHEFLALIMVSQEYFQSLFDLMYDKIQISYGINCSAFSKKQTIEGESNMKITEIRKDLQTLDLKELIIKHYLGQYRREEIQEALDCFQIKVEINNYDQPKSGKFPRFFYVFQGKTYEKELSENFIFAPYSTPERVIPSWEKMSEVRAGDIIFHGVNGEIVAVSQAKSQEYKIPTPDWSEWKGVDSRRIDIECNLIKKTSIVYPCSKSLITKNYKDVIIQFCKDFKYAPFNKKGTGNQGYLFDLPKKLGAFFCLLFYDNILI